MINQLKIGYIEVAGEMLEEFWTNNRKVVPLEIQMKAHCNTYKYLCYSKDFRVLEEGELIPTYEFKFIQMPNCKLLINIKEVKC